MQDGISTESNLKMSMPGIIGEESEEMQPFVAPASCRQRAPAPTEVSNLKFQI
jgi:hypothetical protein